MSLTSQRLWHKVLRQVLVHVSREMTLSVMALLLVRNRVLPPGDRVSLLKLLDRWYPAVCGCEMRLSPFLLARGVMVRDRERRLILSAAFLRLQNGWVARHLTSPATRWALLITREHLNYDQVLNVLCVLLAHGLFNPQAQGDGLLARGLFGP